MTALAPVADFKFGKAVYAMCQFNPATMSLQVLSHGLGNRLRTSSGNGPTARVGQNTQKHPRPRGGERRKPTNGVRTNAGQHGRCRTFPKAQVPRRRTLQERSYAILDCCERVRGEPQEASLREINDAL